jgi:hypothetical protein
MFLELMDLLATFFVVAVILQIIEEYWDFIVITGFILLVAYAILK